MTFRQRLRYVSKVIGHVNEEYDELGPALLMVLMLFFVIFSADIIHSISTLTMPGIFTCIFLPGFVAISLLYYGIILANDYDKEVQEEMFPTDDQTILS